MVAEPEPETLEKLAAYLDVHFPYCTGWAELSTVGDLLHPDAFSCDCGELMGRVPMDDAMAQALEAHTTGRRLYRYEFCKAWIRRHPQPAS